MRRLKTKTALAGLAALLTIAAFVRSYSDSDSIPVVIDVPSLTISKLPFIIALDQELYAKHGLKATVRVPVPKGLTFAYFWSRVIARLGLGDSQFDIGINGGNPMMVRMTQNGPAARKVMIGATDCVVRAHVIGRKGIASVEELKGRRIGISNLDTTSGFQALLLARRMGWDPAHDVSLMTGYEGIDAVLDGSLDAMIGAEFELADAKREGLPVLLDMREWDASIAGNSIMVSHGWLDDPTHREAARRFLRATAEAIALFHQQPELVRRVLEKRYGIADAETAKLAYERGAWIPRKPYPCYDGIKATMATYDSNEMRRYQPSDFYDDSILREIDATGFIDALYRDSAPSTAQSAAADTASPSR